MTPEAKARFKARMTSKPYRESIHRMMVGAVRWAEQNPGSELKWRYDETTLQDGDLADPHVHGYLAASPAAFRVLAAMNAAVVNGTLLQARMALVCLRWVGPDEEKIAASMFERKPT